MITALITGIIILAIIFEFILQSQKNKHSKIMQTLERDYRMIIVHRDSILESWNRKIADFTTLQKEYIRLNDKMFVAEKLLEERKDKVIELTNKFTECFELIKQKDKTIKFLGDRNIHLESLTGGVEQKYVEQSEVLKNEAVRIAHNNFLKVLQTSKEN